MKHSTRALFAAHAVIALLGCRDQETKSTVPKADTLHPDAGVSNPDPISTSDGGGGEGGGDDAGAGVDAAPEGGTTTMTITAPWADGASIPSVHTCDGANTSPALSWSGAPAATQSFAIVMKDNDLADGSNYHWVLFDLADEAMTVAAALPKTAALGDGSRQTNWSFGAQAGYGGPCPPSGSHTYEITVYALNTKLGITTTDAATADAAIQAAKIGSASVRGTYAR